MRAHPGQRMRQQHHAMRQIHQYSATILRTAQLFVALLHSHLALLWILLFLKAMPSWKKRHVGKVECPRHSLPAPIVALTSGQRSFPASRWPLDKLGCLLWHTCPSRTSSCPDQKPQHATVVLEVWKSSVQRVRLRTASWLPVSSPGS